MGQQLIEMGVLAVHNATRKLGAKTKRCGDGRVGPTADTRRNACDMLRAARRSGANITILRFRGVTEYQIGPADWCSDIVVTPRAALAQAVRS